MQGSQLQLEKEMAIKSIQSKVRPFKENPKEKSINLRDKERSINMGNQFDPLVHMDFERNEQQQQQQFQGSVVSGNQRSGSQTKKNTIQSGLLKESANDLKQSGLGKKKKKKGKKQEISADGSRPETGEIDSIENSEKEIQNQSQLQQKVLAQRSELVRMDSVQQLSLIHISEPTRQAEISYAVFCLKKKKKQIKIQK
eukprot:TRINITY_DN16457_c0_g1_i1.p2 TRINITY_DN16457_c0_g1~~TRINITY_DN16457_c0_g1_i1.p2  ORF type:complete len:198 (-),score=38.77 TRINITY_DN16457_c0_g1_i1:20-613(-)